MRNIRHNNLVIADSGYWVALGNIKDRFHHRAKDVLAQLTDIPVTTWPVITETSFLLRRSGGIGPQLAFLRAMGGGASRIFELESDHFSRMETSMKKYQDLPMDLADASLVILAEELGHGRILSTDRRDFHTYRWKNHEPFENLLLPED
jgi:predicted nucleic acid-binding protein